MSITDLQAMYEQMVTARHYEEQLVGEYFVGRQPAFDVSAGPIFGELHLAAGHEASGVGICMHLRGNGTAAAPHQPHRIAIAKGVDLRRMTAEIFSWRTELCRGKGGHMHLFDSNVNFACAGIIAQGCPPAVGATMAAKKRSADSVAVAFLGKSAIDQGGFLELLSLTAVRDLPVVFVVGDNDRAISMPKDRVTDVQSGAQRAAGFDPPDVRIDSDDATAIHKAAGEAVMCAHGGDGSTLIEVQVHHRVGHFMGDAGAYRPEVDIDRAKQRDSIERLVADLRSHGVTDDDIDEIREHAHGRVEAAVSWAREQPKPEPAETYESVFTNPPAQAATDGGGTADAPDDASETGDDN